MRHSSQVLVDLHDALRRREISGGRHFLDEALDIGAEELESL